MGITQSTPDPRAARGASIREMLAALPGAAYTCDVDGRITFFNERAAELWGRRPNLHDAVDRYCGALTLFTADGARVPHEASWTALTLQTGNTYEGRSVVVLRPDGSRRNVLASASPLYDDAGTLVGALSLLTDITDQLQSELRRRERDAHDFFENGALGVHWIDVDGVATHVLVGGSGPPLVYLHGVAPAGDWLPLHAELARLPISSPASGLSLNSAWARMTARIVASTESRRRLRSSCSRSSCRS